MISAVSRPPHGFLKIFRRPADAPLAAVEPQAVSSTFPVLPLEREELLSSCPEWQSLIQAYIRSTPVSANQLGALDLERFLTWLDNFQPSSREERDLIMGLQSWHTVEFLALEKQLAAARFATLLEGSAERLRLLGHEKRLHAFLNPVHVWSSFQSRKYVSETAPLPCKVLFFGAGDTVRTLILSERAESLLRMLENGPQRAHTLLCEWSAAVREQELQALRELVGWGVIALA